MHHPSFCGDYKYFFHGIVKWNCFPNSRAGDWIFVLCEYEQSGCRCKNSKEIISLKKNNTELHI